jgi:hypothetical protein
MASVWGFGGIGRLRAGVEGGQICGFFAFAYYIWCSLVSCSFSSVKNPAELDEHDTREYHWGIKLREQYARIGWQSRSWAWIVGFDAQ